MNAENLKGAPDAAAIIEAVGELAEVDVLEIDRGSSARATVLALPDGKTLKSIKPLLDEYLQAPERREGTATLHQVASFVEHVNRFKDEDSAIFASVENATEPKLVAVLDYHRQGPAKDGAARFGRHRAIYRFPVSDEWTAWSKATREPMNIQQFAEFLEDRVVDIIDPATIEEKAATLNEAKQLGITLGTPQGLLEVSRGLTINVKAGVTSAHRLSSGETQVSFNEVHEAASKDGVKSIAIPGGFAIGIPVFRGGLPYRLLVRLRYRIEGASIRWSFAISRTERTWQTAVQEACEAAGKGTSLPLFYGSPEV